MTPAEEELIESAMLNWSYCPPKSSHRKEWLYAVFARIDRMLAAARVVNDRPGLGGNAREQMKKT